MSNAYKQARLIYFNTKIVGAVTNVLKDGYGLQVRNSLYSIQRRHPGKRFKTRIKDKLITIKRVL